MTDWTLAIIAGGKSSRMGRDKSFVDLNGKPLINHVIERTAELGRHETILVTNKPDAYAHLGLTMVGDVIPDKGALGGIYTAVRESSSPYVLVVACDMPFLSSRLLAYMLQLRDEDTYDVIVPRVAGYPQGLHAVYSHECSEPIAAQLKANKLKVIGFYDRVRVRYIDEEEYGQYGVDGDAFMNLNTPEELERARQLIDKKNNI